VLVEVALGAEVEDLGVHFKEWAGPGTRTRDASFQPVKVLPGERRLVEQREGIALGPGPVDPAGKICERAVKRRCRG
jgi:hypothetical protein